MSTYNGTIYHGIKLDLENNFYWFQSDKLEILNKQEFKNYKLGQKLDIRELWRRYENSELSFGFCYEVGRLRPVEYCLNSVLETIVTDIDRDYILVEYFRCAPYEEKRCPINVDENGYDTEYDVCMLSDVLWWDVDCLYRDTFILKGARRNLVKEADFSVCYEDGNDGEFKVQIGSMLLDFWVNTRKRRYCLEYEVLGWQIEEKDDCTILNVDLQAHSCQSEYELDYDSPYDVFERHWETEMRLEGDEEDEEWDEDVDDKEDEWDDVTTFDGECSVVVKFYGKPRLSYNYNGKISVGDKVMVSGKLADIMGKVVEINGHKDAPYMQNVVEIVESPHDENDEATENNENVEYNGTTYHGIKLDLEHNFYWFQPDVLENLSKQQIKNYKIGQKLDIRELWRRHKYSELSFGFGDDEGSAEDCLNNVLETVVTDVSRDCVQVEYFRCAPYKERRRPLIVDENGCNMYYDVDRLTDLVWWDVDCFYRDSFILKGAQRELVKEKDFSICYKCRGGDLTIQIGSMTLDFWLNVNKHRSCSDYKVLGWQIEEKDDCAILRVDLQACYCPAIYELDNYSPYNLFEYHCEAEARIKKAVAECARGEDDEETDRKGVTTFVGKCSVVVKFPGKPSRSYNYDGKISVGDKVRVSGKLAGLVGTVMHIEEPWEGDFLQNIVEIVESGKN